MPPRLDDLIKNLLQQSEGSRTVAQQRLLKEVWADEQLLRALVAPFLKPLTMAAIDRVARPLHTPPLPHTAAPVRAPAVVQPALAASPVMAAGYSPMKATQAERVGLSPSMGKPPEASARHVSTLKLLAAAYQVKRGERV